MSAENTVKGSCQQCGGRLSFPANAAGASIPCPHCGENTELIVPPDPGPPPSPGEKLKVSCPNCQGKISFPREAAGMEVPCPHCSESVLLTAPGATTIMRRRNVPMIARKVIRPKKGLPSRGAAAAAAAAATSAPESGAVQSGIEEALEALEQSGGGSKPKGGKARAKGEYWEPSEEPKSKTGLIVGISVAVVALLAVGGFFLFRGGDGDGTGNESAAVRPDKDLEVLEYHLQKAQEGGLFYVVGTLTNHGPVQYFDVKVEFELQDLDRMPLGNTSDYNGNLPGSNGWSFKALVLEEDVSNVKLLGISGEPETAENARPPEPLVP